MPSSRIPPAPVTHPLMVVIICGKYGNNRCRPEKVTERTRFSKSRSNDLEDIGQGQRSSHATHLLMLVIICTKYGKNPSRTVDVTEWKRFSRSRPNDNDNDNESNFIAMNYINHITRDIQARLIDGKKKQTFYMHLHIIILQEEQRHNVQSEPDNTISIFMTKGAKSLNLWAPISVIMKQKYRGVQKK